MNYVLVTKRTIFVALTLLLSAVLVISGISNRYEAAQTAKTQERKIPVYCVETSEKKIAVTFDAAWGAEDTEELLSVLQEYNAKATVFVVGDWARKYPEAVRAFYDAGHTIGNHSDSHKAYSRSRQSSKKPLLTKKHTPKFGSRNFRVSATQQKI